MRYYILYRKEKADDKIARLNGLFLIVFSVIGLVALACGLYLTFHLEMVFKTGLTDAEYHTARILMLLLTANLAVSFPMSVFSNIISAQEQFVFLKATEILRTVVSPLVTLPVLLAGYGSIGMVVVTVTISVFVDVLRLIYCFGKLHIWVSFRNFDGAVLKDIAVFSGFIAINMVVDQVNNNLDKLIITRYCGTAATAVYAVGQQLHTYFISFSTAVSSVFTPRIHQLVQDNKDDKARLRTVLTELFVRVGRIQFLILSLVCTGIIFFGKPFIYFWAGPGYDDAYIIVLLLIIPGMVPLTQNLGIEMQRAQNLHKYRSIIYGAMAIGNLAISIWLCQYLGAIGCAIGTAVAVALANGLVMNIFYQRRLNIDVTVFWKNIGRMALGLLPPAACGVLMMLFVNLYSIPMLLGGIIVYTAIYCASVWLLSMNGYEKALVGGMVRKVLRK